MARNVRTDSGNYTRPAQIQKPAARVDDGQGGNANANQGVIIRSPMIHLFAANFGRGLKRTFQYGQLYPTANHWAEMRYANDEAIDASMILLADNRRFQILGAIDVELAHVTTLLALVELQAQGSK